MKRFFSLLLCLAMLLSVAGCGNNNDAGGTGTTPPANDGGNGSGAPEGAAAIYRKLYSSEVTTLNYLSTGTTLEFEPAANVIDTLDRKSVV